MRGRHQPARSARSRRCRAGRSGPGGPCRGTPARPRASRHASTTRFRSRSALSTDGATAQAARRVGDWRRMTSRATASRISDGTMNQRASRRRPLNAWPSPGSTADRPAAARRRRSVGPVSGRIRRACTRAEVLVGGHLAPRGRTPSLAPSGRFGAWRRRAIDQPASDRPASGSVTTRATGGVTRGRSATRDGRSRGGVSHRQMSCSQPAIGSAGAARGRYGMFGRPRGTPHTPPAVSAGRRDGHRVRRTRPAPPVVPGARPRSGAAPLHVGGSRGGHPSRHRTRRRRRRSAGGARPRDTSAHGWSSRTPDSRPRRRAGRGRSSRRRGSRGGRTAAPRPTRRASAARGRW